MLGTDNVSTAVLDVLTHPPESQPVVHIQRGRFVYAMTGRIPITDVTPTVDAGAYPAKSSVGETFTIAATVFREGHDSMRGGWGGTLDQLAAYLKTAR